MEEFIYFLFRWFHFLAGITWIGLLYYFNFVQTPFFGSELGGGAKAAMTRGLVPNALWWFRWGAMITFATGPLSILMKLGVLDRTEAVAAALQRGIVQLPPRLGREA